MIRFRLATLRAASLVLRAAMLLVAASHGAHGQPGTLAPPGPATRATPAPIPPPRPASQATCDLPAMPPALTRALAGIEGDLVQSLGCRDQDGEHWFVETRQMQAAAAGRPARLALTFTKLSLPGGGRSVRRWQARDFADVPATTGATPPVVRLVVKDVDLDGRLEAFIAYTLPRPDAGLDDGKLLVFYKDRKHAIRGAVASRPGDFASRTVDEGFAALPPVVRQAALTLWDHLALPVSTTRRTAAPGFALIPAERPASR